jgi:hypothetical protein
MRSRTGPGLTAATSAPGQGSPLPHLHRDWARSLPHPHRDWAQRAAAVHPVVTVSAYSGGGRWHGFFRGCAACAARALRRCRVRGAACRLAAGDCGWRWYACRSDRRSGGAQGGRTGPVLWRDCAASVRSPAHPFTHTNAHTHSHTHARARTHMHAHTLAYMVETSHFMRASSHAPTEACALCRTRASDTEQRAMVQLTAAIASSISTICPHLAADAVPCHPRVRRDWPTSAPGLAHICAGTCPHPHQHCPHLRRDLPAGDPVGTRRRARWVWTRGGRGRGGVTPGGVRCDGRAGAGWIDSKTRGRGAHALRNGG